MTADPSPTVIEAVEQALIEHFGMESCGCGSVGLDNGYPIGSVWLRSQVAEVARAAEQAALTTASERFRRDHAHGIGYEAAAALEDWADELTDKTGEK